MFSSARAPVWASPLQFRYFRHGEASPESLRRLVFRRRYTRNQYIIGEPTAYDKLIVSREMICKVMYVDMTDLLHILWKHANLPVEEGGFGIRRTVK